MILYILLALDCAATFDRLFSLRAGAIVALVLAIVAAIFTIRGGQVAP